MLIETGENAEVTILQVIQSPSEIRVEGVWMRKMTRVGRQTRAGGTLD